MKRIVILSLLGAFGLLAVWFARSRSDPPQPIVAITQPGDEAPDTGPATPPASSFRETPPTLILPFNDGSTGVEGVHVTVFNDTFRVFATSDAHGTVEQTLPPGAYRWKLEVDPQNPRKM